MDHRSLAAAAAALLISTAPVAAATGEPVLRADKLVVLSTTDVKGKTSPCGCRIPKGGLARLASYVDGVRAEYGQVLLVDNGGFFPDQGTLPDPAAFLMSSMKILGTDAVGIGERDFRFGLGYLRAQIERTGIPMVCANLFDRQTGKPLVSPYLIKKVGTLRVGIFGLISHRALFGQAKDSVRVEDPAAAARRTVASLRQEGADVVVLLAQLGKTPSEDLVAAVEGIDAVIIGHNAPMLQKGRKVKNTVACYGGEQGQYVCRTELSLDERRHPTGGEATAVMLGPDIAHNPKIMNMVRSFEESFNTKTRKSEGGKQRVQTGAFTPR